MLPRRPAGFVVAGNVVFDVLVRPVSELKWNASAHVESIGEQMGGNGSNTAYTLAKLGAPVCLAAYLGKDWRGEFAAGKLREAGVDLGRVRHMEAATATSVVLVHPSGARMFLHEPGVSRLAFPEPLEFDDELVGRATHFHLANPFSLQRMRQHAAETLRRARARGLTTSLDAAWDAMGEWGRVTDPCLAFIDLLFVNEDEARRMSGCTDPDAAARYFQSHGTGDVVVKMGAGGCLVYTDAGRLAIPGFPVECVDSTGAGDVFAGAWLAALWRGAGDAEAARQANAAGALAVEKQGAVTGVLGWEPMQEWIARHGA